MNVPATLADEVNREHLAAFGKAREALEHARRAGELLLQAKAALKHGGWLAWVKEKCHFAPRTAQRYIRLAQNWGRLTKCDTMSHLTMSDAIQYLAHQADRLTDMPEEMVERVADQFDKHGGSISQAIFKTRLEDQRQGIEEYESKQDALLASSIEVSWPDSWSFRHKDELAAQAKLEPEIAELEAQYLDLCRRREAVIAELEKLNQEHIKRYGYGNSGFFVRHETEKAIERRHGPLVQASHIRLFARGEKTGDLALSKGGSAHATDPELFKKIREAVEIGDIQTQLNLISRCTRCAVHLSEAYAEPVEDKPGFVYAMCRWCRSHRGETHCMDCGKPLRQDRGELTTCEECLVKDLELDETAA
jgi:DUF3102 family protein